MGVVCEDGREYYAINYDCDWEEADDWVKENVLKQLPRKPRILEYQDNSDYYSLQQGLKRRVYIAQDLMGKIWDGWVGGYFNIPKYGTPEIWGWYPSTDWVCFYQLFGKMVDIPKGLPWRPNDIEQLRESLGSPELPKQVEGEHNALSDANYHKNLWEYLTDFEQFMKEEITIGEFAARRDISTEEALAIGEKHIPIFYGTAKVDK